MRIAIIGNCGSGKSILATKLHKILNIPVYHLDQYCWNPGWQKVDRVLFEKKHQEICDKDEWIIDGIARRVFEYRVQRADIVIFLDIPTWRCLYRILKRAFTCFGKVRDSSAAECFESFPSFEFLKFIVMFNKNRKPIIEDILQKYKDKKKIFVVKNNNEIRNLIKKFELKNI